jgi:uncharacterized protein
MKDRCDKKIQDLFCWGMFIIPALMLLTFACSAPPPKYNSEIEIIRVKKNAGFLNSDSPLDSAERANFPGIFYYPADISYKVNAKFTPLPAMPSFDMPHTLDRTYPYKKAGDAIFTLNGKSFTLVVYTNEDMMREKKLFIPFTDLTNGKETYGGGRYLEIWNDGSTHELELDFNLAYFPYCAYSHRFSCPLVPKENHLDTEVKAGEKLR